MNTRIILLSCLCLVALCICCSAKDDASSQLSTLVAYSETNDTNVNITLFSPVLAFGLADMGTAVKFTAPYPSWRLQRILIYAWSGYNESTQTYPSDRNIMIEVRDKDRNLLYKFADAQNNYFSSDTGPIFGLIEIPDIKLTGDFYVVYYDRLAAPVGALEVKDSGNSYLFQNDTLIPAKFNMSVTNETLSYNWMIEVAGK